MRTLTRLRAETGTTLVEMMVGMSIMVMVAAIFLPLLTSSMGSAQSLQAQSEAVDNVQLGMVSISRELRSAQCITSPAENTSGTTLDFSTSANNSLYEVVYSVSNAGVLTRQVAGSQRVTTVADHLVNFSGVFKQISTPRRTVVLTFSVRTDPKVPIRSFTTTIAGRNAWRTCPAPL